ncbi:hypothetical protein BDV59DRAFT_197225 [Aspergillus ambiguus]|uniref:uncharacterized protein n=1 Tax=Aspergillus ambiguus TaxID=176160 RepID=UPI003CCD9D11
MDTDSDSDTPGVIRTDNDTRRVRPPEHHAGTQPKRERVPQGGLRPCRRKRVA